MIVKATREGLIGKKTASGIIVTERLPYVALPSHNALFRFIRVTNPTNGISTLGIVLDVGPWNTHDDAYVFHNARPQAELGIDTQGRQTNGAGIDLGQYIWKLLQMRDNTIVEWWFLHGTF